MMNQKHKGLFDYTGKVAVVTGAAGSIGSEIARAFAQCGAHVVLADIQLEQAEKVRETLENNDQHHICYPLDLRNIASIKACVQAVVKQYGSIDFLSNHAGVNVRKPALEFTEDDWDLLCDINLKGHFFMAQAVAKVMKEHQFGRIVNTASVSSKRGHPNLAIYAATKGGVIQLTKVLANEWSRYNIRVNAVAPGYIITNQTKDLLNNEEEYKKRVSLIPLGRFGEVKDIADSVMFLCSEMAQYILGQTLYIDGGRTID